MMRKKLYWAAAILLVLGIAACVIALAMSNFKLTNLQSQNGEYTQKTYDASGDLDIVATDTNVMAEISTSPDNMIHLTYYDSKRRWYDIEERSGTLYIDKKKSPAIQIFSFDFSSLVINLSIQIPENYTGDLKLTTSNASINAEKISAGGLTLKSSNGKIGLTDSDSDGCISITSSNASLTLENCNSGDNITIDTRNGSINIQSVVSGGYIDCSSQNDSIKLRNVSGTDISAQTSNGSVTFEDVKADNTLEAESSNAGIYFSGLAFGKSFYCKTNNNRISGSLPGYMSDYSIESKTFNGDNSLPSHSDEGDKDVTIKTSNGDIDVDFEH